MAFGGDINRWELPAEDKPAWRSALKAGGERLEANWLQKLAEKELDWLPSNWQLHSAMCSMHLTFCRLLANIKKSFLAHLNCIADVLFRAMNSFLNE